MEEKGKKKTKGRKLNERTKKREKKKEIYIIMQTHMRIKQRLACLKT